MDDDDGVRKMLELIFDRNFETTDGDSSIPPCFLTNDFPLKLRRVLLTREALLAIEWRKDFDKKRLNSDTSLEEYVAYVLLSCMAESQNSLNVFEGFIGVCSFVRHCSQLTKACSKLNYCSINVDIVMAVYKSFLKEIFIRRGGFLRLIKYIHNHRYLKWDLHIEDLSYLDHPPASPSVYVTETLYCLLSKEIDNWKLPYTIKYDKRIDSMRLKSVFMAQKILEVASVKLSTVPNDNHQNKNDEAHKENKTGNPTRGNEHLEKIAPKGVDLDSKNSCYTATQYEKVIQAVIKHNRSKSSGLVKSKHYLQMEEILLRLKNSIQTLIQILDS